jgi:hypothetical protein
MTIQAGIYFPSQVNLRVPALAYVSDIIHGEGIFSLGVPTAVSNLKTGVDVSSASGATTKTLFNAVDTGALYGRAVSIVLSGAGTPTVSIFGVDYLGQPVQENFTANGATPVNGKKAFRYIFGYKLSGYVAATTLTIASLDILGVPYRTQRMISELVNQLVPTAGTFVAAIDTDPQTATTGDPRGTYTPNAATDGVKSYQLQLLCFPQNLHGVAHFST